jgi:hypothetical protein
MENRGRGKDDAGNFLIEFNKLHGKNYKVIGTYTGNRTRIEIKCLKHNFIYLGLPETIRKGTKYAACPKCISEAISKSKKELYSNNVKIVRDKKKDNKISLECFKRRLLEIKGNQITYVSGYDYISQSKKARFSCKDHGEFESIPYSVLRSYNVGCCPKNYSNKGTDLTVEKDFRLYRLFSTLYSDTDYILNYVSKGYSSVTCVKHNNTYLVEHSSIRNKVIHAGCSKCARSLLVTKDIIIDYKKFRVAGFEDVALRKLIDNKNIFVDDVIKNEKKIPIITYHLSDGKHSYYPDFYIKRDKLLVEVKSAYTLLRDDLTFTIVKTKAKACLSSGFNFKLMLIENVSGSIPNRRGDLLDLPDNWYELSLKQIKIHLGYHYA